MGIVPFFTEGTKSGEGLNKTNAFYSPQGAGLCVQASHQTSLLRGVLREQTRRWQVTASSGPGEEHSWVQEGGLVLAVEGAMLPAENPRDVRMGLWLDVFFQSRAESEQEREEGSPPREEGA